MVGTRDVHGMTETGRYLVGTPVAKALEKAEQSYTNTAKARVRVHPGF